MVFRLVPSTMIDDVSDCSHRFLLRFQTKLFTPLICHSTILFIYDFFFDKKALITSLIPSIDSSTDSSIFTVYYSRGGKNFMLIKHREREGERRRELWKKVTRLKFQQWALRWPHCNASIVHAIENHDIEWQNAEQLGNLLNGHVPPNIFDRWHIYAIR